MKFLKLASELITDKNITSNEFRIYAYLLSLYNEAKECSYPSMETIAEDTNISLSTVKRGVKKLAELGYMVIEKRDDMSGNNNKYKSFKYLVPPKSNNKKVPSSSKRTVKKDVEVIESEVKTDIDELLPFTMEH